MATLSAEEIANMPLHEFINLPTTVSFYYWYTISFQNYLAERPYIKLGKVLKNGVAILYTDESYMDGILAQLGYDVINVYPEIYGLTSEASLEAAGILRVQERPYLNLLGSGVSLIFVDTGIDYTNPTFQYEDGTTRISYIWDQTIDSGEPTDGAIFGTVYTREKINEALRSDDPYSIVPHRDEDGHGTFLASVAAGRRIENFIGAAPEADIIVIKLKGASQYYRNKFFVPENQKNAYESIDIMLGITFGVERAEILGNPSVSCIGLGTNFGGHNGQNRLESYITSLSSNIGIAVCTAVGNESNARHHTSGTVEKTGETATIEVRAGEMTKDFSVYVWYEDLDKISFSLKSPTGEVINRIPFFVGTRYEKRLIFEKSLVRIFYHQDGNRFAFFQIEDAVPGIWEITLHGDVIINGRFNAWLPMTGFVSPDVEFVSPVPNYTTVIPSTAIGAIAVAAYNDIENSLYINSSWGPALTSKMVPDFAAPGVNIKGYYPYGLGTMTGTSAAAAITSGAAALVLQWAIVQGNAPATTGNRLRSILIRGCTREARREYPNVQWGYGTLNLIGTFNSLRES